MDLKRKHNLALLTFPSTVFVGGRDTVAITTIKSINTEIWGAPVVTASYYEEWDEEVSCRHSYDCMCSTDSDGNASYLGIDDDGRIHIINPITLNHIIKK